MKSIVFVITTLKRTGPVNILYDIVKYLDRSNYDPHIITLCEEEGNSRWEDFEKLNVSLSSLKLSKGWRFIKEASSIKKIIDDLKPDIIHTFGFRADVMGAIFLAKHFKISSQLNNPFEDYVMTYGNKVGGFMAHMTLWALKRFDHVVACSRDVKSKLHKKGLLTDVIYNAIDVANFLPATQQEKIELRKKLNIWNDVDVVFIFVGVLSDRKQPLIAIQAFLNFQKIRKNSALLVLGSGSLQDECQQAAQGHRVIFFGNVPDTRPYLAASDVYIATSKAEGMPVSVIEAMAMKLPVILSDIEPHQEILGIDNKAGLLCKTGSVENTTQAMVTLAQEDIALMGTHARSIIDLELNAQVMSKRFQEIYQKHN